MASAYDIAVTADSPKLFVASASTIDASGTGKVITSHGSPSSGRLPNGDSSYIFNATGTQYISIADHADFSVPTTGILTIECWMYPTALAQPHADGSHTVNFLSKCDTPNQFEWELRFYDATSTDPNSAPLDVAGYVFNLAGGVGHGLNDHIGHSVGQWVHYVEVINTISSPGYPNGYVKIYRDGALQSIDTLSLNGAIPLVTPGNGTAPVRIGAGENLSSYWYGGIGKVAIYSTELSATRISFHYSTMVSGAYAPRFPGDIAPGKMRVGVVSQTSGDRYDNLASPSERRHMDPTQIGNRFGVTGLARWFPSGATPATSVATSCQQQVNLGRVPWVSVKMTPWATARPTSFLSMLVAMASVTYPSGHPLAGQPADIWVTVHHEPENDVGKASGGTVPEYCAQQVWARSQIEAAVQQTGIRNVAFAPIFMFYNTFDVNAGTSGTGANGGRGRVVDIDAGANYSTSVPHGWWHTNADTYLGAGAYSTQGIWDFVGVDIYDFGRVSNSAGVGDFTPKGFINVDASIAAGTGGRRVGYGPMANMTGSSKQKIYSFNNFLAWCKWKVMPFWGDHITPGAPWAVGELGNHHTMGADSSTGSTSVTPTRFPHYGITPTKNPDQRDALQSDAILDLTDLVTSWGGGVIHRCLGLSWWDDSVGSSSTDVTKNANWILQDSSYTLATGAAIVPTRSNNGLQVWRDLTADAISLLNGYYGENVISAPHYQIDRFDGISWVRQKLERFIADTTWSTYRIDDPTAPPDLPLGWNNGSWNEGTWNDQ